MGRPSDACEASRSMLRCSMLSTSIVDAAHVSSHGLLSTSNTVWGKHLIFSCYLLFDKSQPFEVCQTSTFYQFFMLWFTIQRSDLRTTPKNTVFPAKVCVFLLSPLLNCHQNLQFFYLPAIHALLVCIFGFNTDTKWRNQSDFSCGIKVCKDNSRIQVNFELIKLENICVTFIFNACFQYWFW